MYAQALIGAEMSLLLFCLRITHPESAKLTANDSSFAGEAVRLMEWNWTWQWTLRGASVFFVLLLWVVRDRTSGKRMTDADMVFGVALAAMGGVVACSPGIPLEAGIPALAVFGLLSRLAAAAFDQATAPSMDRSEAFAPAFPGNADLAAAAASGGSPEGAARRTFIVDGRLLPGALRTIGKTDLWVRALLDRYGIASVDEVALAQIDERERIMIVRKSGGADLL